MKAEFAKLATQLRLINDFKTTLESQYNKTLIATTRELSDLVHLKLKEIGDLSNELTNSKAELISKDAKIKNLEKKIGMMEE